MKTNIKRNAIRATLLATVLLTGGLFGSPAKAQSAFQGTFTLSQETRWGQAVLAPGDYVIAFDSHDPSTLVVRDATSRRPVAFESVQIRDESAGGKSALLIGVRGAQRVIHTLRIAELGEEYVYDPKLAHGRVTEEARQTEPIPVLFARK